MREIVEKLLELAGIEVGGSRPWDIVVHNSAWYQRVWRDRNLGLGESYMDGWWDCPQLDAFFARLLSSGAEARLDVTLKLALRVLWHRLFNFQSRLRAWQVAHHHYDLGNDLYQAMLDPAMNYSCAYWKGAQTLAEAQLNKLELVCRKLMLGPGMRLLDIGCGWGALARHAAERFGTTVVGLTLSRPQKDYAEAACVGLPVEIRLQDYRDLEAQAFDRVVSVGMFEHVGHKNHRTFMDVVERHLTEDGVFLLHTIGGNLTRPAGDPWITKYIFPNGEIPSAAQITRALEGRFVIEDWHNLGPDYDRTLLAWHRNFTDHWAELKGRFNERFRRMWDYYLLSCAGAFRARDIQLWQIVMSKRGIPGGLPVRT
jgi:cyclopropane-fatty-acyl-phospholipid synthase